MAGDWIKMRNNLDSDPRVFAIAESLGLDDLHVVGLLWKTWAWADQHTLDGNAVSVTASRIDRLVNVTGFAEALRKVGWLEVRDSDLTFPRFGEHNGQSAKKRAQTASRVAKRRNALSVTEALTEKRREEKRINSLSPTRKRLKKTGDPEPHPEWSDLWQSWIESWEGREGRAFDPIKAQIQLGELLAKDPAKAKRDLEFSLKGYWKSIRDSDDDWSKAKKTDSTKQSMKERLGI